ncbi:hypothetical protein M422DRAFT_196484, partial [Sphaerobolus stellatus SS14]
PDMYFNELQQQLYKQHAMIIGLFIIWRMLKSLGLTCKKLACVAAEHNKDVCNHYRFKFGAEAPNHLVFIEESCINCQTSYHLKGWAPQGKRAIISSKFMYSLLPALCSDGIIYADIRKGAYNGPAFIQYIEDLLDHMNPKPQPKSVHVMDNCAIHHIEEVMELCEEHGVHLYYLPPYSPDLNPIKESFIYVKSVLHHHGQHFQMALQGKNEMVIHGFIYAALATITPDLAQSWMNHSGYW